METVTIPRKLSRKGNLVVIPQKEYEELLRVHKKHNKFYEELDKDLDKAVESYKKGKAIGPFSSVADLKKSLEK
jgi:hypothetical protein